MKKVLLPTKRASGRSLASVANPVSISWCDAVLLDVNLAGQPVDELATLLTRNNRPFAFVTGYGREALPPGFRGAVVLGKPFGADQLLATVEVLLYQPASIVQFRHKKV